MHQGSVNDGPWPNRSVQSTEEGRAIWRIGWHDARSAPWPKRSRFAGRIFAFTEEAALNYGELMGEAARAGRPMGAPDGMIAAIARVHSAPLATRNVADFRETGVVLVDPWRG